MTNLLYNLATGVSVIGILLMLFGVVRPIRGHGASMAPTIREGYDFHIGLSTKLHPAQVGDIVSVIKTDGTGVIKRVIAKEGDIVYTPDGCTLYVNGIREEYVYGEKCKTAISNMYAGKTWTLGNGEVFIAGDNRNNSKDSRSYGVVKEEQIDYVIL